MTRLFQQRTMLAALLSLAAIAGAPRAEAASWIMRHGLTAAEYQDFYDSELPAGYRPISVSANGTGAGTRYTVIAVHDPGVPWGARHGLTSDEYQSEAEAWAALGYRIVAVDASGEYPNERYVAAWVDDGVAATDWAARHRMTDAQFQTEFDDLSGAGFRMTWIAGYGSGADRRFAAVWRKNDEGWSWKGRWGLDADDYQAYVEDRAKEGYRVVGVTGYDDPDDPLFGAVFLRPDGPNWEIQPQWAARHQQDGTAFQDTADDFVGTFFQPTCAIQYGASGDPRFGSAWFEDTAPPVFTAVGTPPAQLVVFDDAVEDFMVSRKISRGTLAVTKDGRLVLSRAYTYAPPTTALTQTSDRFRVASVTKPLTAVAVLQLVEAGLLDLDTQIEDIPGFPGDGWGDDWFNGITVRNLLQHTGGWDRDASFDPMFRNQVISDELGVPLPISIDHIITYMKDTFLDFFPGSDYAYSNFGYCLLGRVIEAVSGEPYEDSIRNNVLCRIGATDMVLGRSLEELRYPDEVEYRDPMNRFSGSVMGGGDLVPVTYGGFNLENMDAHGAWVATATELARFVSDFTTTTGSVLLDSAGVDFMWQGTPQSGGSYGAGWQRSGSDRLHGGSLTGTRSYIIRRADGVTISVVLNQRSSDTESPVKDLDWEIRTALGSAADTISLWPPDDHFPSVPKCLSIPWDESFDDYTLGRLVDQSSWEAWDDDRLAESFLVSDAEAHSAPQSVAIDGSDDAVHRYFADEGVWRYTAWVFVPRTMDDLQHFILLNTYPVEDLNSWSLQLELDGANDLLADRNSSASLPLIKGAWAEIRVDIDLERDEQTVYYDGTYLLSKSWSGGVAEGGATAIGAVDLYGTGSAHEVAYDDLALEPIPTCVADLDGSGRVDTADLVAVLAAWGPCAGCPEDLDGSGAVDTADLVILLASWGPCS